LSDQDRGVERFLGGLLFAAGALMSTLSGLCTGGLLLSWLPTLFVQPSNALASLLILAVFGGVPFAAGVGLIVAGREMFLGPRPRRTRGPKNPTDQF